MVTGYLWFCRAGVIGGRADIGPAEGPKANVGPQSGPSDSVGPQEGAKNVGGPRTGPAGLVGPATGPFTSVGASAGTSTLVGPSQGAANLVGPSVGVVSFYAGSGNINGDDGSSGSAAAAAPGGLAGPALGLGGAGLYFPPLGEKYSEKITRRMHEYVLNKGGEDTSILAISVYRCHRCCGWWCRRIRRWPWRTRRWCCCDQRTVWRHPRWTRLSRSYHPRGTRQVLDVLRPQRSRLGDGGKPTTVTYRSQTILKRAQRLLPKASSNLGTWL